MIDAKIDPIRRDLDVLFGSALGPEKRAKMLAETAAQVFAEVDRANAASFDGVVPQHHTFVDGSPSEQLVRVKPDGVIVRTYEILPLLLSEIGKQLWQHSPVLTGFYQSHHHLLADGNEIATVTENWQLAQVPPNVREFLFIPSAEYARMLEPVDGRKAHSKKAPDGVYHVVAGLLRRDFLAVADVSFTYRSLAGTPESKPEQRARPYSPRDMRQPCILVVPK